ncbi:MAG TPA: carboxylating nicotinate-nucleotide diphosphorylase [Gemmataceae bacterium]|nr:carboxylating nicotinate-nucleotide diphosphorylase [Gemmataceae bacterium]
MGFTPEETLACRRLVEMALEEDLGTTGDLTSKAVIPADLQGRAAFVARAAGVLAGLPAVELVLQTVHTPLLKLQSLVPDGTRVAPGDRLAVVSGLMEFILTSERTALNFLQHLSGIATLTRRYVDAVAGLPCRILDTRKTTPGWRLLEKYAVRCGGGHNHRLGLYDGILIKDNHLAALNRTGLGIYDAVERAQQLVGSPVPMEIEVDNLDQLEHALACRPQIILLDNMSREGLREAVRRRELKARSVPEARGVLLEASGGVTLETVRAIAETGVERISVGALTHSAAALDIGLDYIRD